MKRLTVWWFSFLTDLSFDWPGLAVLMALFSGVAAGCFAWASVAGVLWLIQFVIWGGFHP